MVYLELMLIHRPLLVVVAGRPGAGKTTLAHALARIIRCPAICRDEVKEGYVRTFGAATVDHTAAARAVYNSFFATVETMLASQVSLIAEAAFQHHVWSPSLEALSDVADIRLVLCEVSPDLAFRRMEQRYQQEPWRQMYHPMPPDHKGADEPYNAPRISGPMLSVDTSDGYQPPLENIVEFLGPKMMG